MASRPEPSSGPDRDIRLVENEGVRFRKRAVVTILLVTVFFSGVTITLEAVSHSIPDSAGVNPIVWVIMTAFAAVAVAAVWFAERSARERLRAQSRQRLLDAESQLEGALRLNVDSTASALGSSDPLTRASHPGPAHDLALPALWTVTHARLSDYHRTAVDQATRSFRNAQYAAIAGFVLIAAFVVTALSAKSATGSIAAGALGAVAAALSGYIAKTFIRSQEMTSKALHAYFEEPLTLSRYLAAERLVRDSSLGEEKQAELLHALILAMVGGPEPEPEEGPVPRQERNTGN